jgi:allantoicase
MFFGNKNNMIMPGRAANMGGGWETRRRRDLPGHDWAVVKLAAPGLIRKIEVDTKFYKGNYPDSCTIEGVYAPDDDIDALNAGTFDWKEILPNTKLQADHQHYYEKELRPGGPYTHLLVSITPDGGISRLRVHGTVAPAQKGKVEKGDELKSYQRA